MLEIVRSGLVSLRQSAIDWLEIYSDDRPRAMLDLVQFVFLATGYEVTLTSKMLEEMEPQELVAQMATVERLGDQVQISLMVGTGQEGKKFRANFCEFLRQVVVLSKNSILYDNMLMISWSDCSPLCPAPQ